MFNSVVMISNIIFMIIWRAFLYSLHTYRRPEERSDLNTRSTGLRTSLNVLGIYRGKQMNIYKGRQN